MPRIGRSLALLLAAFRSDQKETVATGIPVEAPTFTVEAPWQDGEAIPARYTCDGGEERPDLRLSGLPEGTTHLAVLMDDPDAPRGTWVHWLWWDEPAVEDLEGSEHGVAGKNSWGRTGYGGPCPPSGTHRYFIHVYALNGPLGLPPGSDRDDVASKLPGRVIGHAVVQGTYSRVT